MVMHASIIWFRDISSFCDNHIHFITDIMQDNDDVPVNMHLALYHQDGFLITTYVDEKYIYFSLEGSNIPCYPSDKSTILFRFPYNSTGLALHHTVNIYCW
jgi:hypothetical protein